MSRYQGQPPLPGTARYASSSDEDALFGSASDLVLDLTPRRAYRVVARVGRRGLVPGTNTLLLAYFPSIHPAQPIPHRGPPSTEEHGSATSVRDTDPVA